VNSTPAQARFVGVTALGLFALKLAVDAANGEAANSLWFCFIGNLCLGLGLVSGRALIARIGALCTIAGLPVWAISMTLANGITLASTLAHVGGSMIAAWVIATWRRPPWRAWHVALAAWLLALAAQTLCRWFTPPELNVNLSHSVYAGWEGWFPSYALYAVFVIVVTLVVLVALSAAIDMLYRRLDSPSQPLHETEHA
jgi:hypothetical protein